MDAWSEDAPVRCATIYFYEPLWVHPDGSASPQNKIHIQDEKAAQQLHEWLTSGSLKLVGGNPRRINFEALIDGDAAG